MANFFRPNLDRTGRIIRGALGVLTLASGAIALHWSRFAAAILLGYGAFALFEAVRGWCVVRACGIKTKY